MMKRRWLVTLYALVLSAGSLLAATKPYVVTRSGNRISGSSLRADADGNLTLEMQAGGPKQNFKRGQYKAAFIPKPSDVSKLEAARDAGKFDIVLKYAPGIYAKYKYLGWADAIAAVHAATLADRKQYDEALALVEEARKLGGSSRVELEKAAVMVLVGKGRTDEAGAILDKLVENVDARTAAFAFNGRGSILAAQGKDKDAVLEYMKTLLLFKPGQADPERKEARRQVVALLTKLGDPRAKDFASFE